MAILRCTKKLLSELKTKPEDFCAILPNWVAGMQPVANPSPRIPQEKRCNFFSQEKLRPTVIMHHAPQRIQGLDATKARHYREV
jgi:hypothetical protein